MRRIASTRPGTGACTLASAMQMWLWTLNHLQSSTDPDGSKLYHTQRQGVTFAMADALCWLLASRCQILDVLELEARGAGDTALAELLPGTVQFLSDLCHVQAAKAAGEVSRICAELVFGYKRHPSWNDAGCSECFSANEIEELEETMPGITAMVLDVLKADGSHPEKAGPCAACAPRKRLPEPAKQAQPLPQRIAPGQGPRRRNRLHRHDSRSAGLPAMRPQ